MSYASVLVKNQINNQLILILKVLQKVLQAHLLLQMLKANQAYRRSSKPYLSKWNFVPV